MTQARATIVVAGQQGLYHCTNRCVRRAWLCGIDPDTKQDYEHRKQMVAERIKRLGEIFAVGIYGYAVMSNHLHVVLSIEPSVAATWSDEDAIERWLQLCPARTPEQMDEKRKALLGNPDAVTRCRERLTDLSWFMRGLAACRAFILSAPEVLLAHGFVSLEMNLEFSARSKGPDRQKPVRSFGLRGWTASAALRRLPMEEPLAAHRALHPSAQPHNASHAESPTGCKTSSSPGKPMPKMERAGILAGVRQRARRHAACAAERQREALAGPLQVSGPDR